MNRLPSLLRGIHASKGWRAWQRYGEVRGNVLAGGVAYFALFSLFPALALGFTVFGLVVDDRADLQDEVARKVNETFGITVIGPAPDGIWTVDQLVQDDVLTGFGLVGLVVILFTGLGWVGALRDGISAVFGRRKGPNVVLAKASDLGILTLFGAGVLVSAVGSVLVTAATGPVLGWLGLDRTRLAGVLVSVLSALLLLAIDTALFLMMFRFLSGVRPALDDVFTGALAGAVGLGLLKLGGGVLLRLVSGNRVVAAFGILVGLLLWMNLAARLALLASAWAATTAHDRGHLVFNGEAGPDADLRPARGSAPRRGTGHPEPVRLPVGHPEALEPTYGARSADRTTLLAGAILGVTAAVGAGVAGRAGRTLRGPRRSPR